MYYTRAFFCEPQPPILRKPLPVRPLSAVRAHVRGDAARLREPAAAHGAAEWLLPGVRPAVGRQVGGLREGTNFKRTCMVC